MVSLAKVEAKKRHNNDEDTWDNNGEYPKAMEVLA